MDHKISGLEALILVLVCIFFDILDILATFLDAYYGIGELLKIFINAIISPILWFWTTMKGARSEWILYGGLLELIPIFGNTLPIRTVTMIVLIYIDWHPKVGKVVKSVAQASKISRKR